jgi:hypothetical protein
MQPGVQLSSLGRCSVARLLRLRTPAGNQSDCDHCEALRRNARLWIRCQRREASCLGKLLLERCDLVLQLRVVGLNLGEAARDDLADPHISMHHASTIKSKPSRTLPCSPSVVIELNNECKSRLSKASLPHTRAPLTWPPAMPLQTFSVLPPAPEPACFATISPAKPIACSCL